MGIMQYSSNQSYRHTMHNYKLLLCKFRNPPEHFLRTGSELSAFSSNFGPSS